MKTLRELKDLKGKSVLLRVDFNVPLRRASRTQGKLEVEDDARIQASLSTIKYLSKKGAKVILMMHLGRPEGKINSEFSVKPILKELEKLLQKKVKLLNPQGEFVSSDTLSKIKVGEITSLENIRFYPEEENNDKAFAQYLASLADIFVLDGFAVSHRESASVSGVQKFLPSYAGLLLEKEILQLDRLLLNPKKPFVAVLGGAKIETKLPVIKNILKVTSRVLLGGALFNTYLKSLGYEVGTSLVESVDKKYLAVLKNKNVVKPVDVLVGKKNGSYAKIVPIAKKTQAVCESDEAILDIGPKTLKLFEKHMAKAKTLVWNGAMGYFENEMFAEGTYTLAKSLVKKGKSGTFVLVGGGETLLVMEQLKLSLKYYHVSTGGGALLEYLSGKKLPGIKNIS